MASAVFVATSFFAEPASAGTGGAFLLPKKASKASAGFSGICSRYTWGCEKSADAGPSSKETQGLAKEINSSVNRNTRQIEDEAQYGKDEHWALPTLRGGDCEDLALLEKRFLNKLGIVSEALLISTVLDRNLETMLFLYCARQKVILF